MSTGRTTDDRDRDAKRHREAMDELRRISDSIVERYDRMITLCERIELGLTAAGVIVVQDPSQEPDLLDVWKPEPRSWTVRRECRSE